MKYLVCKKQHGEGCDYTIGCGMDYSIMEAESVEHAVEMVVYPDGRDELSSLEWDDGMELKEIIIVPITDNVVTVDVRGIAAEISRMRAEQEAAEKRAAELAELERLRAKYGVTK